jgi:hypothetical protein
MPRLLRPYGEGCSWRVWRRRRAIQVLFLAWVLRTESRARGRGRAEAPGKGEGCASLVVPFGSGASGKQARNGFCCVVVENEVPSRAPDDSGSAGGLSYRMANWELKLC